MGYRQQYDDPDEQQPQASSGPPAGDGAAAGDADTSERIDSVAAQIRRQLRDEGAVPQDKSFDFQMTLRAGGNELNDTAQEFAGEAGGEYQPPEFNERGWEGAADASGGGGAMRGIVIGVLLIALLAAAGFFGWPALRDYQQQQEQARLDKEAAERPPFAAVTLDDTFQAVLEEELGNAAAAWKSAGKDAYIYRYGLTEELVTGLSQNISINAAVGGKDSAAAADDPQAALAALAAWKAGLEANTGVSVALSFEDGNNAAEPPASDRYIRYGYDYGRENMAQLQPVIDAIAARSRPDRVLSERIIDPPIKTNGGFSFVARGFGYLPIYKTDSAGNIQMGSGGTLASMTPQEVTGYYLFLYVDSPAQGMDFHGQDALDYYTRKIAPLPYDTGGEKLKNVPLKPDGKPDGIGCVVKNGKLLPDGER